MADSARRGAGDDDSGGADASGGDDDGSGDGSADETSISRAGAAADRSPASGDAGPSATGRRGREVVVPDRVYKRVTVFSTLFAVVTVVVGFVLLDAATDRATAPLSEIDPLLGLVGLGCIVLGAVTYAFSTRFRAEGMGNAKDESDEPANNG